jgi:peptidoglycan/LPS O-acetylase OafA/YrhL
LKPGLSLYLDLFRLTLALTVVVFHASYPQMGGRWFVFPWGLTAVIGFFVLSGFVISYVAATKESGAASYAAARLARLWSILIPALALTPVFDSIGRMFSPAVYEGWGIALDHPYLRLAAAATFLNEIWFWSIHPLSNIPVWSLGFEAWFYTLFGAFIFSRGWKRAGLVYFVGLIAGPKIFLLFPPWLLGVWLYSSREKIKPGRWFGVALFAASPVLIFALQELHFDGFLLDITQKVIGPHFLEKYFKFASPFLWQNLVGVLTTAHLAGAMVIADELDLLLAPVARFIRIAAGYTLSIYLLHFPIELMIAAILHSQPDGPIKTAAVVMGAVALAGSIGVFIEPQRYWLKTFLWLWFERHF